MKRLAAAFFVLASTLAPAAFAQYLQYPTHCKVHADGTIKTSATIATPLLVDNDADQTSLAASFAISSASSLTFNDLKDSWSDVSRNGYGDGGCVAQIVSSIVGQTTYFFTGDTTTMDIDVDSITVQDAFVTRTNVTGTGLPISASNSYEVPQVLQLTIEIPFIVTGNQKRDLKVTQFDFARIDTTATTGSTVGAYQIFADNNANCRADSGDSSSIGGKGIVGPNDTYSEPSSAHVIPPGNYVLVIAYFTDVDLAAFSANCSENPNFSGWETDGFDLTMEVQ